MTETWGDLKPPARGDMWVPGSPQHPVNQNKEACLLPLAAPRVFLPVFPVASRMTSRWVSPWRERRPEVK